MSKQDYAQLMLFPGDSPASPFLRPGSAEARKMTVTSGRKCSEFVRSSSPLGLLARMLLGSSVWQSQLRLLEWKAEPLPATRKRTIMKRYYHDKKKCCSMVSVKTLKVSAMKSSRLLYRLVVSAPTIKDTELQLWRTPGAEDSVGRGTYATLESFKKGRIDKGKHISLANQVRFPQLFPTPTRFDASCGDLKGKEYREGSRHAMKLIQAVDMWPTPSAMDAVGLDKHLRADATPTRSILLSQKALMYPTPTASLVDHGGPNQRDSSGRPGLQAAATMWPTPRAQEYKDVVHSLPPSRQKNKGKDNLTQRVARTMLPTPRANDAKKGANCANIPRNGLPAAAKMLPTPTSRAGTGASETETRQGAPDLQTVCGGQLNPEWVAWLMGFPAGWLTIGP